mmetsp:Transcript_23159/g.58722  ORF Transcript_23159/g.58722 Transcript_23159/m.58722 type:complete len:80 (+) Transcript_23159:610-849(+)
MEFVVAPKHDRLVKQINTLGVTFAELSRDNRTTANTTVASFMDRLFHISVTLETNCLVQKRFSTKLRDISSDETKIQGS